MIYCVIGKYVDNEKRTIGYRISELNLNLYDIDCILSDKKYINLPYLFSDLCFNVTRFQSKFYKDMTVKEYEKFKNERKKAVFDFFSEVDDSKLPVVNGLSSGLQSIVIFKKTDITHNTDIYMLITDNGNLVVKSKSELLKNLALKTIKNTYKTDDNIIRVSGNDDLEEYLKILDEKWGKKFELLIKKSSKKLNNMADKNKEVFYTLIPKSNDDNTKVESSINNTESLEEKFKDRLELFKFWFSEMDIFIEERLKTKDIGTLHDVAEFMNFTSNMFNYGSVIIPTLKRYQKGTKYASKLLNKINDNKAVKSNTKEIINNFLNYDYYDLLLYYINTRCKKYFNLHLSNNYCFYWLEQLYYVRGTERYIERKKSRPLTKLTKMESVVYNIYLEYKNLNPNGKTLSLGKEEFEKIEKAFLAAYYFIFESSNIEESLLKNVQANIVCKSNNYTILSNTYINEKTILIYKSWEYKVYTDLMYIELNAFLSTQLKKSNITDKTVLNMKWNIVKERNKGMDLVYKRYIDLVYDITCKLESTLKPENIKTTINDRVVVLNIEDNSVYPLKIKEERGK